MEDSGWCVWRTVASFTSLHTRSDKANVATWLLERARRVWICFIDTGAKGRIFDPAVTVQSIVTKMRARLEKAGVDDFEPYTTHSLSYVIHIGAAPRNRATQASWRRREVARLLYPMFEHMEKRNLKWLLPHA